MQLTLLIFSAYLLESFVVHSVASGYYWRDYYGEIPDDAFPGGRDVNGGPIYIGQTSGSFSTSSSTCHTHVSLSKIYGSNKKVYYILNGSEYEATNQVKILCTQHPEQFEWILTDNEKIKVLTAPDLILGGYEPGCTTYIGRARGNGEILVGKALTENLPIYAGLWTTANGKAMQFTEFEVLSFNKATPLIQKSDPDVPVSYQSNSRLE